MEITKETVKVERVRQDGNGVGNHIWWKATSADRPSMEEVAVIQRDVAGYHPAGYGGPHGVSYSQDEQGQWVTRWYCFASCD